MTKSAKKMRCGAKMWCVLQRQWHAILHGAGQRVAVIVELQMKKRRIVVQ